MVADNMELAKQSRRPELGAETTEGAVVEGVEGIDKAAIDETRALAASLRAEGRDEEAAEAEAMLAEMEASLASAEP